MVSKLVVGIEVRFFAVRTANPWSLVPDDGLVERPRLLELVGLEAADEVRRLEAQRVQQRAQRDLELRAGGGRAPPARPTRVALREEHLIPLFIVL